MPNGQSGLQQFAEMKFEGSGSQSDSMKYLALVASVVGNATQDTQLLQIADALAAKGQQQPQQAPMQQPPVQGGM